MKVITLLTILVLGISSCSHGIVLRDVSVLDKFDQERMRLSKDGSCYKSDNLWLKFSSDGAIVDKNGKAVGTFSTDGILMIGGKKLATVSTDGTVETVTGKRLYWNTAGRFIADGEDFQVHIDPSNTDAKQVISVMLFLAIVTTTHYFG